MKDFGVRIDIDTKEGLVFGVPNLLSLFKKLKIKASFYVPMGGQANLFELIKYRKDEFGEVNFKGLKLSKKQILKSVLFPENFAESEQQILREILKSGHCLGVHGWKHRLWTKGLDQVDISTQFENMVDKYKELFNKKPTSFAAPAFRTNTEVLECLDAFGFKIASDLPGKRPFHPVVDSYSFEHTQVPITLRVGKDPVIEYLDSTLDKKNIVAQLLKQIKGTGFSTIYLHAGYEGVFHLDTLDAFLQSVLRQKYRIKPLELLGKAI